MLIKYWKGCILDLVECCNTVMAINISEVIAEYLKDSFLDLVECCLRLSDVFYFSSIYIEGARTKISIFFSCVLGGGGGWKVNKKE